MSPTPPTEERLARQWSAILARTTRPPPRARWPWAVLAFAMCAAAVLFFVARDARHKTVAAPAPSATTERLAFEMRSGAPMLSLPDGVRVQLTGDARIELERSDRTTVVIELVRGVARFEVDHDPSRTVVVRAGDVRIEDVGTHFSVERHDARVTVNVTDGAVRVRHGANDAPFSEVHAGETWSHGQPTPVVVDASDEPDTSSTTSVLVRAPEDDAFATFKSLAAAHRDDEAYAALGDDGFSRAMKRPSASDLFLLGDIARRTGHTREAARAYDALRTRHRGSEHAGLAAFELGRMRLDALHDAPGAAEALADAVDLAPNAPFCEDARARRVEALDLSGDADACARAKQDYLTHHPHGLYESRVTSRCKPR